MAMRDHWLLEKGKMGAKKRGHGFQTVTPF